MQAGPLVAIAVVGGFVAGALGGTLFSPAGTDAETPLLSMESSAGDYTDTDYEQRFVELSAQNAALNASIEALRASIRDLEGRRPAMLPPEQDLGRRPLAAIENPGEPFSAEEEERFGAYLARIEQQKEDEREERRAQQRIERMERRMDRYTEELGLDAYQREQMTNVLTEMDTKMTAYWTEMRESGSFDRNDARAAMEDMRTQSETQLGQFLTTQQLETYSGMNTGFGFGRDRGGRGGDRGGDGGGSRGPGGGGQGSGGGGRGGF